MQEKSLHIIELLNKHTPSSTDIDYISAKNGVAEFSLYTAFGSVDAIKISSFRENFNLSLIWDNAKLCSGELNGSYSSQVTYAICDGNDADFWNDGDDRDFIFLLFMQNEKQTKDINFSDLENELATSESKSKIYYTLDNCQLLLITRSSSFEKYYELLGKLKDVKYGFTVYGYKNESLGSTKKTGSVNDVIDVEVHFVVRNYVYFNAFFDRVIETIGSNICEFARESFLYNKSVILGNSDVLLSLKNVPISAVLPLYASKGVNCHKDESNLLSNYHELHQKAVLSISSQFYKRDNFDTKSSINMLLASSKEDDKCIANEQVLQGYYSQKIKIIARELGGNLSRFCECAMQQTANALSKYEKGLETELFYRSLIVPFDMFIGHLEKMANKNPDIQHDNEDGESFDYDKTIMEFLKGFVIDSTLKNSIKMGKEFFQVPEFNAISCVQPSKLLTFYIAILNDIVAALKQTVKDEQDGANYQYAFALCPGVISNTEAQRVFHVKPPADRLYNIYISEQCLFRPTVLMHILAHEAAHFIGFTDDARRARKKCVIEMVSRAICLVIMDFSAELSYIPSAVMGEMCLDIEEYLKIKINELVDILEKGDKQKALYSVYVKENIKDAFALICMHHDKELKSIALKGFEKAIEASFWKNNSKEYVFRDIEKMLEHVEMHLLRENEDSYNIKEIVSYCTFILKESYADLIGITIFNQSAKQYIETISHSRKEGVRDCAAESLRIALMCRVIGEMNDDKSWQNSWDEFVNNTNNPYIEKWIVAVRDTVEEAIPQSINSVNDILRNEIMMNLATKYLNDCRCSFMKDIDKDMGMKLEEKFRTMSECISFEKVMSCIDESIENYKEVLDEEVNGIIKRIKQENGA